MPQDVTNWAASDEKTSQQQILTIINNATKTITTICHFHFEGLFFVFMLGQASHSTNISFVVCAIHLLEHTRMPRVEAALIPSPRPASPCAV